MNSMNLIVARNIKRLREEKKLSMDELAKLSGVSKSMLAQVERGEGNPTLSTLWKLSNGMKVPFNALTVSPKASYEVVPPSLSPFSPVQSKSRLIRRTLLFRRAKASAFRVTPPTPTAISPTKPPFCT